MLKIFKNNRPNRTTLSWDEKNPENYVYHRSEEIQRLREETERAKRMLRTSHT